jgi:uncharacterized coiled-coil protein SlyX
MSAWQTEGMSQPSPEPSVERVIQGLQEQIAQQAMVIAVLRAQLMQVLELPDVAEEPAEV